MQKQLGRKAGSPRGGHPRLARQVRIIGGQWKRTALPVLEVEGLRPTPDRVRETLFNWLNHLLDGDWAKLACLDLFAGTGALGFEAASRGASQVLMVESNPAAVRQLEAIKLKLQADRISVMRGDAVAAVQRLATRFHVIFLDPPYHQDWLPKMLPQCERLLATDGLVYVESEFPLTGDAQTPDWLAAWNVVRADKAGMVFYHLLQRNSMPRIEA